MKRRTKKSLLRALWAIPVILVVAFVYLLVRGPSSDPPSSVRVSMTPDRIDRGKYIFTALAACDDCHSQRDFSRLGGPVVPEGRGKGMVMPLAGLPGTIVASNITPDPETGIGGWTDGEKIRAIREGVGKDGRALHPVMPYQGYSVMSDTDVESLVAYLNSLPPLRNPLPKTSISFPASMLIKSLPQPIGHSVPPVYPRGGEIPGAYLASIAGCEGCHTPTNFLGNPIAAQSFAGGRLFDTPFGKVVSANITQDPETGIGKWDFKQFQEKMHSYARYEREGFPKVGPESFTFMPWVTYARTYDYDLESIFQFLKGVKPVSNRVEVHPR